MVYINTNSQEATNATTIKILNQLHKSVMMKDKDTTRKLLFWLNTWSTDYLRNENNFNYQELLSYKRGMVVKADFGFKVGSEQGGLHYALIIENENSKSNKTVTVIPLGSLPDNKTPEDIDQKYEVFLGYSLFKEDIQKSQSTLSKKTSLIRKLSDEGKNTDKVQKDIDKLSKKIKDYQKGTVAILSQICALSKIRIHTPKDSGDELYNFRLDNKYLDEIDNKLLELYTNKESIVKSLTSK
ncbi:type II toxin-antitoxin system PemK/MazF family toxin [Evansella cellulosilytica]|uniref:Type II toxin-antitoxin system PemK/MazF family toxin n=1 Tax=Evansella cellulosilytica (strain ATCC 21833 / DSM 2522 / FERM P-1141 / JCM 9156 / N-4) TaxID=649639 RepID=E6U1I1_EVAC2|nr:type II toxin-antitoxin system PemK/MazF family toxin [Evansella cellulosilytica]ADU30344.1 hypothetical protein Bcell_2083 [Evansella cellulosilytica DSM 2522]